MSYADNPRHVLGKVNIIFADSELSMDLSVETSGNGEISNPEQVYGSFLTPTIKACTMDGNSTIGGGYQMNGAGLITGWWSDVHCDENGVFANPPWIKLNFIERPMIRWTLLGDNKLGQYPIDFDISLYQGNRLVDTRPIRGNNKVGVQIYYAVPLVGITSVKITILKWSAPNAKAKLLQFFDIVEEEYTGADLKEFEILEELCKDGDIGFGINSDTASFTLYNKNRKFDRGYLKSLVLLGRKVVPFIGVEKADGSIEYTKFGTFYSDDWNVPQSDVWVKLKCVDKLDRLQRITYIGYPYTDMANLYDIAEDILLKSGFKQNEFSIDEALKQDYVDRAFLQKGTSWDSLQAVCYAGLCNAYLDRNDVLTIQKEKVRETGVLIGANKIKSYEKHTRNTDFCNYVEVAYTDVEVTTTQITAYEGYVSIDAGEQKTLVVDYGGLITDAAISFLPSAGIELLDFESGVNSGRFVLKNHNASAVVTTVKIQGMSMSISTQTVVASDEKSIEAWGKQEYIYESSDLIQSYEKAQEIAELILNRLAQGNGNVRITWRGDPSLGLQDTFITSDRFGAKDKCVNEYNRYKFNGGLEQETRGRLIDGNVE
jgi:hypothetical protein